MKTEIKTDELKNALSVLNGNDKPKPKTDNGFRLSLYIGEKHETEINAIKTLIKFAKIKLYGNENENVSQKTFITDLIKNVLN